MLLCFPGELTHRFLFWLREPPMATAEMLLRIYSGCFVTETLFTLTSFTFASPSHSHCAVAHHTSHTCHHLNTQPLLCALMLQNPQARRYKCSHVNGSARAPPLRSSLSLSLSLSMHTHSWRLNRQCLQKKSVWVWRICVTMSWGYLAGVRVLFKCERAPSFVGRLNSRSQMEGEGWKMMEGEMVDTHSPTCCSTAPPTCCDALHKSALKHFLHHNKHTDTFISATNLTF